MRIDYYKVLGVARDATANEIKQAFRKLALECHPDRHVQSSIQSRESAGRRFQQVSEAYEVLSDNLKRLAYNKGTHYAGHQAGSTSRYEGPPRRRYYRRNNQGYTTYGSAQARSTYERGTGQRWRYESEYSAGERKERLINAIFFGFALPIFLFADYIEAAFWPKPKHRLNFHGEQEARKCSESREKKGKKKLLGRVPMQTPDPETRSAIRDIPDQGCKSLLENSSNVGYTYVVGQGFGKLQSASSLAPKLPEVVPYTSGPQYLRSLLSMECRLSDLQLEGVHTWLRQRTGVPVNREGV